VQVTAGSVNDFAGCTRRLSVRLNEAPWHAFAVGAYEPKAVLGMGVPLLRIQTQLYDLC
jgi:hypothetical protein